jgi:NAD(P)-dependent dehydrogenase (short-subunit alcohol dehydrogenase family)
VELNLKGKRAVVTGASKGIGRAIAEELAAEGTDLDLASRDEDALNALAGALHQRYGITARVFAGDLASSATQQALAEGAGGADILVNNAGAIPSGSIEQVSEEVWREAWDLKVFGYINLSRAFYAQMKARGDGVIVNIIGLAGTRHNPNYIAGSAGNAALIAFTRALGAASIDHGVRVVGINPALTETERAVNILRFTAEEKFGDPERWKELLSGLPLQRAATPEEVSGLTAFLASDRASYLSGTIVNVDGGITGRP